MRIRTTQLAGEWYPADPGRLRDLLDRKFTESEARIPDVPANALGFVVPHAGIEYSGTVAAAAYRALNARPPRRIVLLGFSHTRLEAGIAAPDIDAYRTPLGDIPVDRQTCESIARFDDTVVDHSVEIQLPFVRLAAPDVPVVPLYVGLDRVVPTVSDAVYIASSDFTHYGRRFAYLPFPIDERTPARVRALDESIMAATATLNRITFYERLHEAGWTICGVAPVGMLLDVLRLRNGRVRQVLLDYQTSGELTADWSHSVSYACLAYVIP